MVQTGQRGYAGRAYVQSFVRTRPWRIFVATVGNCFHNRVTGLAAEAAFFALLSLPPLLFGLAGSIGYLFQQWFSEAELIDLRTGILDLAGQAFTDDAVNRVIRPTLDDVLAGPRFDVMSIGFVLALWSGSRALNVFVDTITIMSGRSGHRGIVGTRALSFSLYVLGLFTAVITIPLVVAGPGMVDAALPERVDAINAAYWPTVLVLSIFFLATLYHVSIPVRESWRHQLPGATLTMVIWVGGSFLLRWVLDATASESTSIYGPLAAPIAVMLWLYLLAIAILIGAALNGVLKPFTPIDVGDDVVSSV
jgi:membrane protein